MERRVKCFLIYFQFHLTFFRPAICSMSPMALSKEQCAIASGRTKLIIGFSAYLCRISFKTNTLLKREQVTCTKSGVVKNKQLVMI